jgi:hypothetical protein
MMPASEMTRNGVYDGSNSVTCANDTNHNSVHVFGIDEDSKAEIDKYK